MECLYALQSFGVPSDQIPIVAGTRQNKKKKRKKTKENDDTNNIKNNNLTLDNHGKWLNLCQLKDSNRIACGKKWKCHVENYVGDQSRQQKQQQIIECPKHSDILNGRGTVTKHPGNIVLRSIVIAKLDEYMNLGSYNQATKLTWEVVYLLKNNYGARFLKEESTETNGKLGCWIEITNEEARMKVRYAFRDKVRRQQAQQVKQQEQQNQQSQMLQPMIMMPTTDDSMYNIDASNYNNGLGGIVINNTTQKKNTIFSTNMQQNHEQLPSLTLSTTTPLIVEQQKNNNTSAYRRQQIQLQQIEEDTADNTSIFLSMTGGGNLCVSGCGNCRMCTSTTGKKRQLQTCFSSTFDCMHKK